MTTTLNIPKRNDGPNIRKLRLLLGHHNQEAFAKLCSWSQQKMSKLERQDVIPQADLQVIAKALGIPVEKIIEYDEEKVINNFQSNFETRDNGTTVTHIENYHQDVSEKILNTIGETEQDNKSEQVMEALSTLTKAVVDLVTQVKHLTEEVAALKKSK